MKCTVRAYVFDVDDTLYLESTYVRSGFLAVDAYVRTELRVNGFFEASWSLFVEGVRGNTFNRALSALRVEPSDEVVQSLVRVYREHEPLIEMLPDAQQAWATASSLGQVAVVTDGPETSQAAKTRALGVDGPTTVLTSRLGPGRSKPHPAAFRWIERVTGLSGPQLVYVADNPHKDFVAPAELGWRRIRIRRNGSLHQAAPSGEDVEFELGSMSGLFECLRS